MSYTINKKYMKVEKLDNSVYCPECLKEEKEKKFYCKLHRYAYKKWYENRRMGRLRAYGVIKE